MKQYTSEELRARLIYELKISLALTGAPSLNETQLNHLAIKAEDVLRGQKNA